MGSKTKKRKGRRRLRRLGRRLREPLVVALIKVLDFVIPKLSLELSQRLGGAVGALVGMMPSTRRRRAEEHLKLAFPEGTEESGRVGELARESFRSTGMIFMESLWAGNWTAKDDARIRMVGEENLERALSLARERKCGIVVYCAHLGTWELLSAFVPRRMGIPFAMIAAKPKIGALEAWLRARREHGGGSIIYRGDAGLAALRHLKSGGALVMLADHNLRGPGVALPFFGKPAHTLLAPARLALQSGAIAMTIFGLREGRGRFVLECSPPMELAGLERDKSLRFAQEAALAREYTERIEDAVRRYPEQYLWMHRRWYKRSETLPYPS